MSTTVPVAKEIGFLHLNSVLYEGPVLFVSTLTVFMYSLHSAYASPEQEMWVRFLVPLAVNVAIVVSVL